jgi:hypothetical protein
MIRFHCDLLKEGAMSRKLCDSKILKVHNFSDEYI